ncbi:unnamed protein product [Anisakis simplex]|uniref:Neuropeptide-Like Protein n=1 Tax=Anisakis simplex TaxID=6269 RepID=A0A0M3JXE1_ANISI|nr:unnamed protein product [Anisakis simplex]
MNSSVVSLIVLLAACSVYVSALPLFLIPDLNEISGKGWMSAGKRFFSVKPSMSLKNMNGEYDFQTAKRAFDSNNKIPSPWLNAPIFSK